MSEVCKDCWKYQAFKEKCFFYWKNKKECSKWTSGPGSEESYKKVTQNFDVE